MCVARAMTHTGCHHDDLGPAEPRRPYEGEHQLLINQTAEAQCTQASVTAAPYKASGRQNKCVYLLQRVGMCCSVL